MLHKLIPSTYPLKYLIIHSFPSLEKETGALTISGRFFDEKTTMS